eukprot:1298839-Amphidinium_carterae.4
MHGITVDIKGAELATWSASRADNNKEDEWEWRGMYLTHHQRKARRKIYVPNWSDPELSGLRPDKYCHMSFTDVKDKTRTSHTRTFKDRDISNATPEDQGC